MPTLSTCRPLVAAGLAVSALVVGLLFASVTRDAPSGIDGSAQAGAAAEHTAVVEHGAVTPDDLARDDLTRSDRARPASPSDDAAAHRSDRFGVGRLGTPLSVLAVVTASGPLLRRTLRPLPPDRPRASTRSAGAVGRRAPPALVSA